MSRSSDSVIDGDIPSVSAEFAKPKNRAEAGRGAANAVPIVEGENC